MLKYITLIAFCLGMLVVEANAQKKLSEQKIKEPAPQAAKKTNQGQTADTPKSAAAAPEPFDKVTVEAMVGQCVKMETEAGSIELEMFPKSAPETVRNFLNLAATGAFDTSAFSRVVPGFIVQGGDLFTRQKMTAELDKRARRTIKDEPNSFKHERGVVSMARLETPDSATTSFFILVGNAPHLDGTFAAFGRVTKGMEVVDAINKMPVEGEKPTNPVRLTRAAVGSCSAQTKP